MKKFCLKAAAYLLLFALLPAVFSAAVDPFNVFHPLSVRDNGVEINKNFVKMTYILHESDRFDALLFGSSRVGDMHVEKIEDVRCYNMTYSNGTPAEHLANLRTLVKNGVVPRRVYLGVDVMSYTQDPDSHLSDGLRAPYELSKEKPASFWKLYLDPAVTWKAVMTVMRGHTKDPTLRERFYTYGWNHDYDTPTGARMSVGDDQALVSSVRRMPQTLDEIAQIVALCRENGIELVTFTVPNYGALFDEACRADFPAFLKGLSEITPFYNFSGHNRVADDPKSFYDPSHPSAQTGDLVLSCMCGGERIDDLYAKGFGWYVTPDNVQALLALLEA
ncbi:MAG: hypothetical protein IJT44_00405 [Clostridia bacterium]|nr:hypothetical protein [Clostridia bacterium]